MNNSYITIIKEKRTALSRKRVPLNQNECTADFRIGVSFEQNLQYELFSSENHILLEQFRNKSSLFLPASSMNVSLLSKQPSEILDTVLPSWKARHISSRLYTFFFTGKESVIILNSLDWIFLCGSPDRWLREPRNNQNGELDEQKFWNETSEEIERHW